MQIGAYADMSDADLDKIGKAFCEVLCKMDSEKKQELALLVVRAKMLGRPQSGR